MRRILLAITLAVGLLLTLPQRPRACTAAVVPAACSTTGYPMLWKHRDTGADNNFLARVAQDGCIPYIALFNAGDSLLTEAWMGINDSGFGIINTASYNLLPADWPEKDREGLLMAKALGECVMVDDFADMLNVDSLRKGIQANFGVIDAEGSAAWYEVCDTGWTYYAVDTATVIRTNFSFSGDMLCQLAGYVRYNTAQHLLAQYSGLLVPTVFTEGFSRSFWHSTLGRDCASDSVVANRDFIPRHISTASLVLCTGPRPWLWGNVGYPPTSVSRHASADSIPSQMGPGNVWRSADGDTAAEAMRGCLVTPAATGSDYLNLRQMMPINDSCRQQSLHKFKATM